MQLQQQGNDYDLVVVAGCAVGYCAIAVGFSSGPATALFDDINKLELELGLILNFEDEVKLDLVSL